MQKRDTLCIKREIKLGQDRLFSQKRRVGGLSAVIFPFFPAHFLQISVTFLGTVIHSKSQTE